MIDITNPLEWNLVDRRSLVAPKNGRILPQSFVVTHNQIFVGVKVTDEPTWRFGGYLTQYISALPSSTAGFFTAVTQIQRYRLTCRNYQAIDLVQALPKPYICVVDLPIWFKTCDIEIFQRNDI
jgi:hypothetical protein